MNINASDFEVLNAQDSETLAKWWCDLNAAQWPEGLPDPEYQWVCPANSRRIAIRDWIVKKVGRAAVDRAWHVYLDCIDIGGES